MADITPNPATPESESIKSSLVRYWDKFRTALKRRRSIRSRDVVTVEMSAPASPEHLHVKHGATLIEAKSATEHTRVQPAPTASLALGPDSDNEDDFFNNDDEILISAGSGRPATHEGRSLDFVEKYELLKRQRREAGLEPPGKIRRVQRPIRMRIHWSCHDCGTIFGSTGLCVSCGHRRCEDCHRSPAKRVRELLDQANEMNDWYSWERQVADRPTESLHLLEPLVPDQPAQDGVASQLASATPLNLVDEALDEETEESTQIGSFVARPYSAIDLQFTTATLLSAARQCHKCDTVFTPHAPTHCESCGHTRCTVCPRAPPVAPSSSPGAPEGGDPMAPSSQVRMVAPVRRVYRKPRLRVRYKCEHCQAMFRNTLCRECGHTKCKNCPRIPPRRVRPVLAPDALQVVEQRLAAAAAVAPEAGVDVG